MKDTQTIYGVHAVHALLKRQPERALEIFLHANPKENRLKEVESLARASGLPIQRADKVALQRLVGEAVHQGVVLRCRAADTLGEDGLLTLLEQLDEDPFLLLLDGVQDPHNLGACFRSADAAGVHAIIVPKDKSVGLTPVVSKVACGAAEILPFVQVTNLVRCMELLKKQNIWLYGAAGEAEQDLYQTKLTGAVGIVMGAEGKGLRRLTREHCDELMSIPMRGYVNSLNVSVATGICMFEVLRQRNKMK